MRENQERFRNANERLREAVEEHVSGSDVVPFVCECADENCTASVEITLAEYEKVRHSPNRFIHCLGHTAAAVEHVVETTTRFELAEKAA
jgi:hypothetical protein